MSKVDLSKLSPAPWHNVGHELYFGDTFHQQISKETDAAFIALARNAYDVLTRRRWGLTKEAGGFWIVDIRNPEIQRLMNYPCPTCPFTALVEADAWYRENVEKQS